MEKALELDEIISTKTQIPPILILLNKRFLCEI